MNEVRRTELALPIDHAVVECVGCGRIIRLNYNGGEMDSDTCCGYTYDMEEVKVDLVIRRKDG